MKWPGWFREHWLALCVFALYGGRIAFKWRDVWVLSGLILVAGLYLENHVIRIDREHEEEKKKVRSEIDSLKRRLEEMERRY